jgi:hypothetical protein
MVLDSNDKIIVTRDTLEGAGERGAATLSEIHGWSGWGDYVDTQYTSGSPFQPAADTWTNLPNNALAGPRGYEPSVGALFAGGKILGRAGDSLLITIEMTALPTTAAVTYLDMAIDIGGAVGRIYPRTFTFPKGQSSPRAFSFTVGAYTLETWEANGGQIQLNPSHTIDIYDHRVVIIRTTAP